jgi:phosphate transport system permease protein
MSHRQAGSGRTRRHSARVDQILLLAVRGSAVLVGLIMLLILLFLLREALPALRTVGPARFFTDAGWYPSDQLYNLTPMVVATVLIMTSAACLGGGLGIVMAIFCRFYAPPRLARVYRRVLEVLAGIPSVVYGFWGLVVIVPRIGQWQPPGPSLIAGVLVVSLMLLPTVALLSEASFARIPAHYLHGAAALGLGRWSTLRVVVLPAARRGLAAALLLQLGRALGETMAVLMVAGNVVQIPRSVFDPVRALPANIVLEMAYALGHHRAALFVSGLLLMACSAALIGAARWISREPYHA